MSTDITVILWSVFKAKSKSKQIRHFFLPVGPLIWRRCCRNLEMNEYKDKTNSRINVFKANTWAVKLPHQICWSVYLEAGAEAKLRKWSVITIDCKNDHFTVRECTDKNTKAAKWTVKRLDRTLALICNCNSVRKDKKLINRKKLHIAPILSNDSPLRHTGLAAAGILYHKLHSLWCQQNFVVFVDRCDHL